MKRLKEIQRAWDRGCRLHREHLEGICKVTDRYGDFKIEDEKIENLICRGDNLAFLGALLGSDCKGRISMIYADPPFYSGANYDATIYIGRKKFRYRAFEDSKADGRTSYLEDMTAFLLGAKELLSDDGLIFIHVDWHIVHDIRILMDEIFGVDNFVNEIIWTYKSGGSSKKHFARKHDNILVYSKSSRHRFFPLKEKSYNRGLRAYNFKNVKEFQDNIGWYTLVNMKDVWKINMVGRTSAERTGYATQKPEKLLENIIKCCTTEGDLVADFFCGSGTLPYTAYRLGRKFIACDRSELAVAHTVRRLLTIDNAEFKRCIVEDEAVSQLKQNIEFIECALEVDGLKYNVQGVELVRSGSSISVRITDSLAREVSEIVVSKLNGLEKNRIGDFFADNPFAAIDSWSVDPDFNRKFFSHRYIKYRSVDLIEREVSLPYRGQVLVISVTSILGISLKKYLKI